MYYDYRKKISQHENVIYRSSSTQCFAWSIYSILQGRCIFFGIFESMRKRKHEDGYAIV